MVLKSKEAQEGVQLASAKLRATPVRISDSDHSFSEILRNMTRYAHLPEFAGSVKEAGDATGFTAKRQRFGSIADKFSRMLALL